MVLWRVWGIKWEIELTYEWEEVAILTWLDLGLEDKKLSDADTWVG